jgi:hypothetical protein
MRRGKNLLTALRILAKKKEEEERKKKLIPPLPKPYVMPMGQK